MSHIWVICVLPRDSSAARPPLTKATNKRKKTWNKWNKHAYQCEISCWYHCGVFSIPWVEPPTPPNTSNVRWIQWITNRIMFWNVYLGPPQGRDRRRHETFDDVICLNKNQISYEKQRNKTKRPEDSNVETSCSSLGSTPCWSFGSCPT